MSLEDVVEKDRTKKILWLSVDKYSSGSSFVNYLMAVDNERITAPVEDLYKLIDRISSGDYGYVVMVLSEGVLLSMLDVDYKDAILGIMNDLCSSDIPHTVFINDYLLIDKEFAILNQDYSINYIRYKEYRLHSSVAYDLIRDFYPSKEDVFDDFLTEYLQRMLFRVHDRGYHVMLSDMLSSDLYSGTLNVQERNILEATAGTTMFFDREEAMSYKQEIEKKESIFFINVNARTPFSSVDINELFGENPPEIKINIASDFVSDIYNADEVLFCNFSISHLSKCKEWKDIHSYAKRYCKDRATTESVKKMVNTLSRKVFQAFMRSIGRMPDDDEMDQVSDKAADIVTSIISNKNVNVMPFAKVDDIITYMSGILGAETHTVFRRYILREHMLKDELDQYLTMFQNYMAEVRNIQVSIDREYTENGILYVINTSSSDVLESNFHTFMSGFSALMRQVAINQEAAAREIIDEYNISERRAHRIVLDYHRKCARLRTEMEYDYNRRMLEIKEQLELGLADAIERNAMQAEMKKRDSQIQELIANYTNILEIEKNFLRADGSVPSEFCGDHKYTDEEDVLISLFKCYDSDPQSLINELNIARDKSSLKKKRLESVMRVMQFLGRYEKKIGSEQTAELLRYVSALRMMTSQDRISSLISRLNHGDQVSHISDSSESQFL